MAAEAERVAEAVQVLGLRYVVLTAVARDDLADHGAGLFTATMAAIRRRDPAVAIEVLTPDFWGGHPDPEAGRRAQRQRLATVLAAVPVCFNHNLETVERLQGEVRRGATYRRSLELLAAARELAPEIPTKSGLMLGLGESRRGGGDHPGAPAGRRLPAAHPGPVPAALAGPHPGGPLLDARRSSRSSAPSPGSWVSPRCAAAPWCAAATTRARMAPCPPPALSGCGRRCR